MKECLLNHSLSLIIMIGFTQWKIISGWNLSYYPGDILLISNNN
ncbi:hypothetical protein yinte0001_6040 [Yersinia intermedia ATCC 29909]|nr:hypothetical protein yinte0001_6040 [Yersinia intermedia ATCC 29909]